MKGLFRVLVSLASGRVSGGFPPVRGSRRGGPGPRQEGPQDAGRWAWEPWQRWQACGGREQGWALAPRRVQQSLRISSLVYHR